MKTLTLKLKQWVFLLCFLAACTTSWAWTHKQNEVVTDDMSGYYVMRGNMDNEYFTVRSTCSEKAFNFYPMTGSYTGTYLSTGDGTSIDLSNLDSRNVFEFIRQSDGNYLIRYCGCPYPCYVWVNGSEMGEDRDVNMTSSAAMASHVRVCKITEGGVGDYQYYFFDGTYTDETGMAFCIASNANPNYRVYSMDKHASSNWESDCRIALTKLTEAQVPAEAKAENLKNELALEPGAYRIGGLAGSFGYMGLKESFSGTSSNHISENIFLQDDFSEAKKDNYIFDLTVNADGSYNLYNRAGKGYVKTEKTNADADRWGYVTIASEASEDTKMLLSYGFDDNYFEIRGKNNINHFYDGSKELCVTNGSPSKWAKWQVERQYEMPAGGVMAFCSKKAFTLPVGYKAYTIDKVSGGKMVLSQVMLPIIPAAVPVVLIGKAGEFYLPLSFTSQALASEKLHVAAGAVAGKAYVIDGMKLKQVEGSTLADGDIYLLASDFGDGALTDGMDLSTEMPEPIAKSFAVLGNSVSSYEGYQPAGYAYHYDNGDLGGVNGMWWMQLQQMTELNFLANASWSGSTVSNVGTTGSQYTADGRIAALGRNGVPEYIIISGGSNDLCRSADGKKGNVMNLGEYTDNDVNTFRGAYNVLLQKLTAAYPKTKIICLSLFPTRFAWDWVNARGWTPTQCDESIETIAGKYPNCYYIDMTQCGIKNNVAAYTEDGDHPNKAGMKLLAQGLAEKLIEKGLITSNGKEKMEWAETQDAYYRIVSHASDNTAAYLYPKAGNSNVAAGEYNLQYYKSNSYNTLTEEDKNEPSLVFHVYTRGGEDNFLIKNCGLAKKPYLMMNTQSDAWSVVTFTDAPTNKFAGFRLFDGIEYGNQAIRSVGNTKQYWRNGSAANGITTAEYNATNMDFDFTFERIEAEKVAWARFCEEVNTDLGMQAGTTPGFIKESEYQSFISDLQGYNLTYSAAMDYENLLKTIQERKESILVPIDGTYAISFSYHATGEYFHPENGILDYSTSYDETDKTFLFDVRKQADGTYLMKNLGNTSAPYMVNTDSDESWFIGCGGRSTNIQMVSTPQITHEIKYYCPGIFRIYAKGDPFAYNSGVSQVTTISSNLPYDMVKFIPVSTVVGVEKVVAGPSAEKRYYDLQGRQVKNPSRGIYICNGKKIWVK